MSLPPMKEDLINENDEIREAFAKLKGDLTWIVTGLLLPTLGVLAASVRYLT